MHQLELSVVGSSDYFDSFRKLYYHLYSNSNTSRAERIIGDLSKLLLVALCGSKSKANANAIQKYIAGDGTANELLFPILLRSYTDLFSVNDQFFLDENSLRHGLSSIANLDLESARSHVLGDAFQALIGPNLRGDKGQFFTPKSIVRCMISILAPEAGSKVVDPACGTGGFLTETAAFWDQHDVHPGRLIGIDKDSDLFVLASALTELAASNSSGVVNANSLDFQSLSLLPSRKSPLNADYVLTNPPFGAKIPIREPEVLAQYELGHVWEYSKDLDSWQKTTQLRAAQDPQTLFVELCVKLLRDGGKMAIVLPEGLFGNTSSGYVLDYLRNNGKVFALIDCPRTSFQPGTDTKTNILFFEKRRSDNNQVKIAVALDCGHDRRGRSTRNDGKPFPDDFPAIAKDWKEETHDFWFESSISNKYYLVPRYYDRKTDILLEQEANGLGAEIATLGEMIRNNWVSIKKGHEVGSEAYGTGDVPFVRTSDISNFEISIDPTKSVSEEIFMEYSREQNLVPGTILMVVDGRYRIGRCAILHDSNYKCIAQSHLRIINVSKDAPFSAFELLYALSLPSVQRDIRSLVFIQSTLGSLGSRIREVKVPIPRTRTKEFSERVNAFADALTKRAALLKILSGFDATAPEL